MERGRFFPPVAQADLDEYIVGGFLGILDEDIKVAILVKHARVEQLILRLRAIAAPVRLHEIVIGVGRLGILVEIFHVGVGRRAVEVEIVFLDVLAVVRLAVSQPEQPFLENRVLAVPEGQRKTQDLVTIADSR